MTGKNPRTEAPTIENSFTIDASVEAVWKALADADELTRWFPMEAHVTPGPGGSISMAWRETYQGEGRIKIWEPNRRLSYSFPQPDGADTASVPPTMVDFQLEGRGGKTHLRMVHSGFGGHEGWKNEYDGIRRGWDFELRGLRHYLEHHPGKPREVVWARAQIGVPLEEAWSRLFGPDGFLKEGKLEKPGEGDRYEIQAATGDRFEGIVHIYGPPKDFCATVDNMNMAFLRFRLDPAGAGGSGAESDRFEVNLWLSTYGIPKEQVLAIEGRWNDLLGKLFPES